MTWRGAALAVVVLGAVALGLGDRLLRISFSVAALAEGKSASAPVVCPFRARTGLPCVGCGGTRAFRLGAQGAFAASLRTNLLGAYAAGACWVMIAGALAALLAGRKRALTVPLATVALASPAVLMVTIVWWLWRLPPGVLTGP